MSQIRLTGEIQGERPFSCYVCGKVLLVNVQGDYEVELNCPRCKTRIHLTLRTPIPDTLMMKHGELAKF